MCKDFKICVKCKQKLCKELFLTMCSRCTICIACQKNYYLNATQSKNSFFNSNVNSKM